MPSASASSDDTVPSSTPIHWIGLRPEARQDVQREPRQAQRRVARLSVARRVGDVDLHHARTSRQDHGLRELLLANRAEHRLDRFAPVRVEGATEVRDRNTREAAQHAVDHTRGQGAADGVLAPAPASARNVVAGLDRLDEPGDVLGLVLEVAVHRDDDVPARPRQAGVHRGMLAEVAFEADGAHAHVGRVKAFEGSKRAVRRTVVHEDQLESSRPGIERCDCAPVELVDRPPPR